MKANIKLAMWIPFVIIIIITLFLLNGFDIYDAILIIGGSIVIGYFLLGFIKRKEALVIEGTTIKVKSPIKYREYDANNITKIFITSRDQKTLRAIHKGENIALCSAIYDISLEEIKAYMLLHFLHIHEILSDEES